MIRHLVKTRHRHERRIGTPQDATGLALVPLVMSGEVPGAEIVYPLAIVILGGLATSTLLNLFLVPVLYLRTRRRELLPA